MKYEPARYHWVEALSTVRLVTPAIVVGREKKDGNCLYTLGIAWWKWIVSIMLITVDCTEQDEHADI